MKATPVRWTQIGHLVPGLGPGQAIFWLSLCVRLAILSLHHPLPLSDHKGGTGMQKSDLSFFVIR